MLGTALPTVNSAAGAGHTKKAAHNAAIGQHFHVPNLFFILSWPNPMTVTWDFPFGFAPTVGVGLFELSSLSRSLQGLSPIRLRFGRTTELSARAVGRAVAKRRWI
jgi:hypothetical protein